MVLFISFSIFLSLALGAIFFLIRSNRISRTSTGLFKEQVSRLTSEKLQLEGSRQGLENQLNELILSHRTQLQAMQAKLEMMDRYRLMVEDTEEFLFEVNYKGQFTYANPVMLERLGYSQEELESTGYQDLANQDQVKEIVQFYSRQYHQKQSDSYAEWEVVNRFGEPVWVGLRVRMAYDNLGRIVSVKGIARDLSIQKAFENRERLGLGVFQSVFQYFSSAILVFGTKGIRDLAQATLSWANQPTLALMDLDWYEVADIALADVSSTLLEKVKEALKNPEKAIFWSTPKNPAYEFQVLASSSTDWLWVMLMDISGHARKLKEAEAESVFFKNVLDEVESEIAVFSPQQEYLFVNKEAVKDEAIRTWMIGNTDEHYVKWRSKNVHKALKRILRFNEVKQKKQQVEFEEIVCGRNDEVLSYRRVLKPVLSADNEISYVVVSGTNLTQAYNEHVTFLEGHNKRMFAISMYGGEGKIKATDLASQETKVLTIDTPARQPVFHVFATTLSGFAKAVGEASIAWPGARINVSVFAHDQEIYHIPKVLIFELIQACYEASGGSEITVSVSTDSYQEIQLALSVVLDLRAAISANNGLTSIVLAAIQTWKNEGYIANELNGFYHFVYPLKDPALEALVSETIEQKLFENHRIWIGPQGQRNVEWLSKTIQGLGAQVHTFPNVEFLKTEITQNQVDLLIWVGAAQMAVSNMPWKHAQIENLKMLIYSAGLETVVVPGFEAHFHMKEMPTTVSEVLGDLWLHSRSQALRNNVLNENQGAVLVDFGTLQEIAAGDKVFMGRLIRTYLLSLTECRSEFERHLTHQDVDGLRFLLHKVRATINTFGIAVLDQFLRDIIVGVEQGKLASEKRQKDGIKYLNQICDTVESQIRVYAKGEQIAI